MDFGTTNLAAPRNFALLSALEGLSDVRERGRNRFLPRRDAVEEELVCPKPFRAGSGMPAPPLDASVKPLRRLRGATSLPVIGEAGREILDILLCSKVNCVDSGSPNKYLNGSPPCRANNPMIRDSHFGLKRTTSSSIVIPQTTSRASYPLGGSGSVKSNSSGQSTCCNSSYVSKPLIRIEGFTSATPESNCGVPAYA